MVREDAEKKRIAQSCLRALLVALVVGTVLNLINQGDALFKGDDVNVAKLLLTFVVPFFVSMHGAMSAMTRGRETGEKTGSE